MLSIAEASDSDTDALVALWTRCGLVRPWNDARADIARAERAAAPSSLSAASKARSSPR